MTFWKWFRRLMMAGFTLLFVLATLAYLQQRQGDNINQETREQIPSSNSNTFNLKR